jgi:predicted RNA binding protein YcfA (HicA-like mRNA interferase family)
LGRIFEFPTRADIEWRDVEALLQALGAEISEGRGSRMRIALKGRRAVFHRPHPGKEIGKGAIRSVREFLENAGVAP